MPKRPSTIALTPDESTIICGDKFGDVYSLPLLGMLYENRNLEDLENAKSGSVEPPQKPSFPAASSRTVHTKKNQEALRNQQKQIKPKPEKQVLQFDHQLLLGHVSLLTDLAYVRLDSRSSPSHKDRDYIITSDRDEHIRMSRGIPQTHIIEGYCLGHTDFVSSLCVPQRQPQILVSGGGDDYLLVWDWSFGIVKQKIDLREYVAGTREGKGQKGNSGVGIAVSGIKDASSMELGSQSVDLIVACEAYVQKFPQKPQAFAKVRCPSLPAIFLFSFDANLNLQWHETIQTRYNVIEVAVLQDCAGLIYTMDVFHEAGTTEVSSKIDENTFQSSVGFHYCTQKRDITPQISTLNPQTSVLSRLAGAMDEAAKKLSMPGEPKDRVSLYNLESLRKRGQEAPAEE